MVIGKILKVNYNEFGKVESVQVEKGYSGTHNNGVIYKNYHNYFGDLDKICYIPEHSGEESDDDFITDFYTHRDFLELCGGQEEIAMEIFDMVDWQHPETLLEELFGEELDYCPECEKIFWTYETDKCPHCGYELEVEEK